MGKEEGEQIKEVWMENHRRDLGRGDEKNDEEKRRVKWEKEVKLVKVCICVLTCYFHGLTQFMLIQGLSQDPSYLSLGQVVSKKPPVLTGKHFYGDFSILTFGV